MTTTHRVLAGYDGTDQAKHAAEWAAVKADVRDWPLVIAMAHEVIVPSAMMYGRAVAAATISMPAVQDSDSKHLNEFAEQVREAHPGLTVTTEYVVRPAAGYLVEPSALAGLVVIGTRGVGGFKASLLGGVADEAITHAQGPVAVIPETDPAAGAIVVGVDEGDSSSQALRYAVEEARCMGAALMLLRCVEVDRHITAADVLAVSPTGHDDIAQLAQESVDELVAEVRAEQPALDVYGRVVLGRASQVLVDASATAALVVVGSRGRGGFTGLLLGSTSRQTLRDTQCPAVVVPTVTS